MKRIPCALLALIMLFTLCACGRKVQEEPVVNTVTITFPEGYTVLQYAALLEQNGVCAAADFEEACKTIPEGYEALLAGTSQDGRVFALEGYLFPDTYEFYFNENVTSVVSRFLKNLQARVTDDMLAKAQSKGLSLHTLLTLASIVQAECSVTSEMNHVSSVFWNRLNSNAFPYLGSDPTRQYVEKKCKAYLDTVNAATPGAYNYDQVFANYCTNDGYNNKIKGLPVGPIGNPGIEAIHAVLNPTPSEDCYFFTDADMGYHYFTNYRDFCNEWQYKYKH